jgi:hypothetical protein
MKAKWTHPENPGAASALFLVDVSQKKDKIGLAGIP